MDQDRSQFLNGSDAISGVLNFILFSLKFFAVQSRKNKVNSEKNEKRQ